jgi:hypothetical protein
MLFARFKRLIRIFFQKVVVTKPCRNSKSCCYETVVGSPVSPRMDTYPRILLLFNDTIEGPRGGGGGGGATVPGVGARAMAGLGACWGLSFFNYAPPRRHRFQNRRKSSWEGEEDLFVFNDTIEGPRAPAVKPGRITIKVCSRYWLGLF